MMNKTKTVYVLGAGFSIEAGAPSQENLVKKILEVYESNPNVFRKGSIDQFLNFLNDTLSIPKNLHKSIPLEDIFTPIDSCIANNVSFKNLGVGKLKKHRELVFELIGKTLQHILKRSSPEYIMQFAKHLVTESKNRRDGDYPNVDNVSVISTNWDIILDNAINNKLQYDNAVVDYCCYVSSYDKHDHSVKPGLEILGRGGYNVKLIKLHGSLNWLQCPKCQRIYVKFNQKIAMNPYSDINQPTCRHCDKNFSVQDSHKLVSNLIMPTFLKDLSNPQYKIIWQNAGIELSEAKKIVFIGYSLPQADFEMRQLLSRMIDKRTEIEVVDYRNENNPEPYKRLVQQFHQFFGREVSDYPKGASTYISEHFK